MFRVNNRNTRRIVLTYFAPCPSVSFVNFEYVNADWDHALKTWCNCLIAAVDNGQWPLLGMTPWIGWQIWVSECVVLIVDNCVAQPATGGLTTIQLCFLPPNMTSVTQPMDPGVNRSLKEKYCSRLIQMIIKAIDFLKDIPKVSILDAMKLLTFS